MKQETIDVIDPFQYSAQEVTELLTNRPADAQQLFAQFSTRYIHVGQLGIDRNTFINWEKAGLIPYERQDDGWRKFSFLEAVWVKTVQELRALGIAIEVIRQIKEMLWPTTTDKLWEYLTSQIKESTFFSEERKAALLNEASEEDLQRIVDEEQVCLLMFFVVGSVINKTDCCLLITKERHVALFPLWNRKGEPDAAWQQLHQTLFYSSYTLVNLWSIIQALALGEAAQLDRELLVQFVTPTEQRILELVKEKEYGEIVIQKDNEGEPTHIRVTKKGVNEAVIKKLHGYLKRGDYKNIAFKTRDGQLIHFEETSVIKLDTPKKRGRPRKQA